MRGESGEQARVVVVAVGGVGGVVAALPVNNIVKLYR